MKTCVVIAMMLAVAAAATRPLPAPRVSRASNNQQLVNIRSQTDEVNPDGSYRYGFELDDGTSVQESGAVKNPTSENAELVSTGSFSFKSPEGETFVVNYVADGNGFAPQGNHLPTPPPIPEIIQRSLAYIASQPANKQG